MLRILFAFCVWMSVCTCFVYVLMCVCICMQPDLSNIRHCLIYCSEVAIASWDPLHLSPYLNGISTAPTSSSISHFNDWINDCLCVCVFMHMHVFFFLQ